MKARASGLGGDVVAAVALAAVLGAGWTIRDWSALRLLRLPDGDDVVRLQQVRDWLGGQRFADLHQHRLGAGLPMHWSRLADLGPATLIRALAPLAGAHAAEVAAVVAWPMVLFAGALALVARIARVVGGGAVARTAAVVAAVAYPATGVFMPGRIDHHGLQVVLLLAAVLASVGAPTLARGAAAGACAAASLVVGLETAPLLAVLAATVVAETVWDRAAAPRLAGWGGGLAAGLVLGRLVFAGDAFAYPACDGFTLDAWRAGLAAGGGALAIAAAGARLGSVRARAVAASVLGVAAVALGIAAAPRCLSPYGGLDPLIARLWLARVEEATPLFAAPAATAIGHAGVIVAGLAATAWRLRAERSRGWGVLLALLAGALAVTMTQLRGAWPGAMLAAPALAALIARARTRGALPLAGAWLGSAGMLYPIAAGAVTGRGPVTTPAAAAQAVGCTAPATLAWLAALPPGTVLAPIDDGARLLAGTPHRVVAAAYHRDNAGNLASYRFFLGHADGGERIAAAWRVRYVLLCDADLAAFGDAPAPMASALAAGRATDWLAPLPAPAGVHLYAVRR